MGHDRQRVFQRSLQQRPVKAEMDLFLDQQIDHEIRRIAKIRNAGGHNGPKRTLFQDNNKQDIKSQRCKEERDTQYRTLNGSLLAFQDLVEYQLLTVKNQSDQAGKNDRIIVDPLENIAGQGASEHRHQHEEENAGKKDKQADRTVKPLQLLRIILEINIESQQDASILIFYPIYKPLFLIHKLQ